MHDGFTNKFTFLHKDHKTTLAPLAPREVSDVQLKMRKKRKAERKDKQSEKKKEKEGGKEKERKKKRTNQASERFP